MVVEPAESDSPVRRGGGVADGVNVPLATTRALFPAPFHACTRTR